MRRQFLALTMLVTLSALPLGAAINALDNVPAATLLLPYFEVDYNNVNGRSTVLTVGNASKNATLAHVTLWTDRGVPTYGFDVFLGGYDIVEIDLRLLFKGIVPQTSPTISPAGSLSGPHAAFEGCTGLLPPANLDAATVTALRNAHRGVASTLLSGNCGGVAYGDNRARGYVTIDSTSQCTTANPTSVGYFVAGGAGIATNNNVLWGEYVVHDRANLSSYGDALVHIEASASDPLTDGVAGPQSCGPGLCNDYTFYRRKLGTGADNREALPPIWMARYLTTGVFGTTTAWIWRDTNQQNPFPCTAPPPPLPVNGVVPFDEREQPASFNTYAQPNLGYATQSLNLGSPAAISIPFASGFMLYDLTRTIDDDGGLGRRNQSFVTHVTVRNAKFGGALSAWPIGSSTDTFSLSYIPIPQCADGIDNDGDGKIDFPADTQCRSRNQDIEKVECSDGIDNDGDGKIDFGGGPGNDPECYSAKDLIEASNPVCDDGIDNDADGLIDWPADTRCQFPTFPNATEAEGICGDGIDNDADGLIDFPNDPGCSSRLSNNEAPACNDKSDNDSDGFTDFPADTGCQFSYSTTEAPQCRDQLDNDGDANTDFPADAGCASAFSTLEGTACDDDVDNDGDGTTDYPADPGCAAPTANNEKPQCDDGQDNDFDGLIDEFDPGCGGGRSFTFESRGACSNGIDDDSDGRIDFPNDTACQSGADDSEALECNDLVDNDGDGKIDFPNDPGCASATDNNELAGTTTRQCSDNADNDGDGIKDYPADPGCTSRNDDNEYNP